tara:strand:- start:4659 stop:5651 length:993 start_codon:yes stop_codon:yes gene_type:complete
MTTNTKLISIVIPVYNEEANVDRAYAHVCNLFQPLSDRYGLEFVFTDNHSSDGTFQALQTIAARDPRVRVIRFSRNFGFQKSILAGLKHAKGQAAVQLDCDLQDPPELILKFLEHWEQGYAVVYGIRRSRPESWIVSLARKAFYRLINALSDDDLPLDAGDFRLLDRRVLDQLHEIHDATPYLRGLIASLGFRQVGVPYDRGAREFGESKFGLWSLIRLGMDGLVNHSLLPLRIATFVGLILSGVTIITICIYAFGRMVLGHEWPAGFATTTILILFSITLNALFLGIIGAYLGRIYAQVKHKPLVIVERTLNLESEAETSEYLHSDSVT